MPEAGFVSVDGSFVPAPAVPRSVVVETPPSPVVAPPGEVGASGATGASGALGDPGDRASGVPAPQAVSARADEITTERPNDRNVKELIPAG